MAATAVLRRQPLGSHHQPPEGDQTSVFFVLGFCWFVFGLVLCFGLVCWTLWLVVWVLVSGEGAIVCEYLRGGGCLVLVF